MEKIGFYAGSFNPFTIGHLSIVERALVIFDKVIVGIGVNISKPGAEAGAEERAETVRRIFLERGGNVEVMVYSGLTADEAKAAGATALIRGVRGVTDFENERTLADVNRSISGLETVLLLTLPEHSFISSSVVRELLHHHHDPSSFLP